jgi:ketosteroid isomerase-like protein
MKFSLLALVLATLSVTRLIAGSSPEDQVIAVEKQWLKAMSESDTKTLKEVLAENWIATTPGGEIVHQSDFAGNESQSKLPPMNLASHTVQFFGDTAVLMGQLTLAGKTDVAFNLTAIFQRKADKWQMIAAHLSLPKTP